MLEQFLAWLSRRLGQGGHAGDPLGRLLGRGALATFFAGAALAVIGSALEVGPAGTAMPDFLAGKRSAEIMTLWDQSNVVFVAWLHLLVDTCVFLPAYVVLGVTLAAWLRRELRLDQSYPALELVAKAAVVFTLLLGLSDLVENITAMLVLLGLDRLTNVMRIADLSKQGLTSVAGILLLLLAIFWYFNTLGEDQQGRPLQRSWDRARLRVAVADIVWRTRYTIAMLTLFALLALVSDQTRDVVVGLAQFRDDVSWYLVLLTFAATAIAILAFSYVAWMWPRLMLRATRQLGQPAIAPLPGGAAGGGAGKQEAEGTPALQPEAVYLFARWWGRIVGVMPLFIVVGLCVFAISDAVRVGAGWTAVLLALFAGGLLVVAGLRLWANHLTQCSNLAQYYDDATGYAGGFFGEIKDDKYKLFGLRRAPIWVPLAALVSFAIIRGMSLYWGGTAEASMTAPVTLAALALTMTFWTSALGYIALDALRKLVPWVLFLIIATGALGYLNWTDNHVVWTAASSTAPSLDEARLRLWAMYGAQLAVAVFVIVGLFGVFWLGWRWRGIALAIGGTLLTLYAADTFVPRAHTGEPLAVPAGRPSLDQALTQWLQDLCVATPECLTGKATPGIPVYFVSSEGGGIRAAYWTAIVLAELGREQSFVDRTFSLSGVSGGAVGEAVWYACLVKQQVDRQATGAAMVDCVKPVGSRDLLTPLLSAWMFEDVLARFVPTSFCKTPGCGFLDRGTWFEAAMEQAVPSLGAPLQVRPANDRHTPHIFLNSTWVETGERAIASDVIIDWQRFPTARDQLLKLEASPALSTAAHNSARFPYANALGAVRTTRCNDGECRPEVKGHLADGGYFDNSGANTTTDILRAFERCLADQPGSSPCSKPEHLQPPLTEQEWPARLQWLRANLVPQAVMIKNGVHPPSAARQSPDEPCRPGSSDVVGEWDKDAAPPRCAGRWKLFADFVGPPITALNTGGTGANGRLSESRLEIEIGRIRQALRPTPASAQPEDKRQGRAPVELPGDRTLAAVALLSLVEEKVLFPLGWYLSGRARSGMEKQCNEQDYAQVHIDAVARHKPGCGGASPVP